MALADSLPPVDVKIKVYEFEAGPFTFRVVRYTERCFSIEADHDNTVLNFDDVVALNAAKQRIIAHFEELYPDGTTPDDPRCPHCGRHARRVMPNPLNADQDVCRYCAERNADELAQEAREWAYDRVGGMR